MSQLFVDGSVVDVSFGDISTARFERLVVWVLFVMWRLGDIDGATTTRSIVSKMGSGQKDTFSLHIPAGTAPQPTEVHTDSTSRITGANTSEGVWYLTCVANDGTGGTDGLHLYTYNLEGRSFLDDDVTGTYGSESGQVTANVQVGNRDFGGGHEFDGEIANVAYVNDSSLTISSVRDLVLQYAVAPHMIMAREATAAGARPVEFFAPIVGASTEPDWSGNSNNASNSSPNTGDNPPAIAPWYSMGAGRSYSKLVPLPPDPLYMWQFETKPPVYEVVAY
jgi:hypothetical protein